MRGNETPYMETEVLLALLNDDEDRCQWILSKMLISELKKLEVQCDRLAYLCERTHVAKAEAALPPETS
jgi:hypothetical protein